MSMKLRFSVTCILDRRKLPDITQVLHFIRLFFQRPPGIGLPDTPVMMHDLNLEEMMTPRYAAPVQPTGKLKVQLQFGEKALHVIIIEVRDHQKSSF